MTYFFYNWNLVPLNPLHLFRSAPHLSPLWLGIYESIAVLFVRVWVFFFKVPHINEIIWYFFSSEEMSGS